MAAHLAPSRALPRTLASEVLLEAKPIGAARLHEVGVVNRLTKKGIALDAAIAWADDLGSVSPKAMARIKSLINAADVQPLAAHLEWNATASSMRFITAMRSKASPRSSKSGSRTIAKLMAQYELPKRRRIFLMRHGDVTYFDDSGRAIDPESVPLNARGREEASAAGREFAAQNIRFDRVIASGLPRTLETAQRVLEGTGQASTSKCGPSGRRFAAANSRTSRLDIERAFLSVFDGVVPEETQFLGGETIGELLDRALPAVTRLRDDPAWDTVLLVLHGGVNRALLSHAITAGGRAFFGHLSQATGCINALDAGDKPATGSCMRSIIRRLRRCTPTCATRRWNCFTPSSCDSRRAAWIGIARHAR